jgi:hypothetical protein
VERGVRKTVGLSRVAAIPSSSSTGKKKLDGDFQTTVVVMGGGVSLPYWEVYFGLRQWVTPHVSRALPDEHGPNSSYITFYLHKTT